MENVTVLLARAIAWIEPIDLNPRGKVFYLDAMKALIARYGFQKFPQKLEDFDETKGATYVAGKIGDTVVEQVVFYSYGILIDTRVSTLESRRVLEEGLHWASKELGMAYNPPCIKRWNYSSSLTFESKTPILSIPSPYQKLAEGITNAITEVRGENTKYELSNVTVNHDQLTRKHPLGWFSIQRRDNTPYSDNKYFSDAPLPTDIHIKLLEQLEKDSVNLSFRS